MPRVGGAEVKAAWIKLFNEPRWHLEIVPDPDQRYSSNRIIARCGLLGDLEMVSTLTERRLQCPQCRMLIDRALADPRSKPLILQWPSVGLAFMEAHPDQEVRAIDRWLVWCLSHGHGPLARWRHEEWCKGVAELYRRRTADDFPLAFEWSFAAKVVEKATSSTGRADNPTLSVRVDRHTHAAARIVAGLCHFHDPYTPVRAFSFLGRARPTFKKQRLPERLEAELRRQTR